MKRSYADIFLILFFLILVAAITVGGTYYSVSSNIFDDDQPARPSSTTKINMERMALVDSTIDNAIYNGEFPGAVVCVVKRADDNCSMGDVLYLKAYGNLQTVAGKDPQTGKRVSESIPMRSDAVFDLASLTKTMGTTLAFMRVLEEGKVTLNSKVKDYIPDFNPWDSIAPAKDGKVVNAARKPKPVESQDITVAHLLTHTSGLPAGIYMPKYMKRFEDYDIEELNLKDSLIHYITHEERRLFRPGTRVCYSCLNYVVLQHIIEKVTGESLDDYASRTIFSPLQLRNTCWYPTNEPIPEDKLSLIVPTELQNDGTVLRGQVHDPIARVLNYGVSGNAGLYSNAEDLAVLSSMIMNRGVVGDVRVLSSATVDAMVRVPERYAESGRTLGWDGRYDRGGSYGDLMTPEFVISHTGYTGTSVAIDMQRGVAIILLTNRVHPVDKGSVSRTRNVVANIVMSAIE